MLLKQRGHSAISVVELSKRKIGSDEEELPA